LTNKEKKKTKTLPGGNQIFPLEAGSCKKKSLGCGIQTDSRGRKGKHFHEKEVAQRLRTKNRFREKRNIKPQTIMVAIEKRGMTGQGPGAVLESSSSTRAFRETKKKTEPWNCRQITQIGTRWTLEGEKKSRRGKGATSHQEGQRCCGVTRRASSGDQGAVRSN